MATGGELTVSILKENTGITDNQLDKIIDQEQYRKLANLFGSCEKYIGTPGLGLGPGQIADVRDCASKNGHQIAMIKALEFWLDENPYRTYRNLIEALLELREGRLVHNIATIGMSVEEGHTLKKTSSGDISKKVKQFEERFRELRTFTLQCLINDNRSLFEIKHSLLLLPLAIRNEHDELLMSRYTKVEEAKSVGGIFAIINSYLSFIDYNLLAYIIEIFGSDSLKDEMNVYDRDMQEFRKTTTISSIIRYLPGRLDHNKEEDCFKLKAKLNFDPDTMTLEDLNTYRKQLASEFLLSDFALLMTRIQKGSLRVEWLIPKSIVSFLKKSIQDKPDPVIQKLQILQLSVNEELLYPYSLINSEQQQYQKPLTKKVSRETGYFEEPTALKHKAKELEITLHRFSREKLNEPLEINSSWLPVPTSPMVERDSSPAKHGQNPKHQSIYDMKLTHPVAPHVSSWTNLTQLKKEQDEDLWNVQRQEVRLGKTILGQGTWGCVTDGVFRGQKVAIKYTHANLIQAQTIEHFKKKIQIMAHLQHPNLVRLLAAVVDEDAERGRKSQLLVLELMETDLRRAYENFFLRFSRDLLVSIFRDVAYALHYLHNHQEPIIHHDVSASNVLLQMIAPGVWKAKLSDFVSANLAMHCTTTSSGAIVYGAPESFPLSDPHSPLQKYTTKTDVYSYGYMMLEAFTKKMLSVENRQSMLEVTKKDWRQLYDIVIACIKHKPEDRLTMTQVLEKLH